MNVPIADVKGLEEPDERGAFQIKCAGQVDFPWVMEEMVLDMAGVALTMSRSAARLRSSDAELTDANVCAEATTRPKTSRKELLDLVTPDSVCVCVQSIRTNSEPRSIRAAPWWHC